MFETVSFIITGTAQGKGRARSTKSGITYTPQKTRNNEAFIKMLAVQAMSGRKPFTDCVKATITVYVSIPKSANKTKRAAMLEHTIRPMVKPDADNIQKSIFDACNEVVYLDDKQVVDIVFRKLYCEIPSTVVTFYGNTTGQEIELS